jgi:hypothetical protein
MLLKQWHHLLEWGMILYVRHDSPPEVNSPRAAGLLEAVWNFDTILLRPEQARVG